MKKNITNYELQESLSSVYLEASKFLKDAGVNFVESEKDHRKYGINLYINDEEKMISMSSPFEFKMSRNTLAGLYSACLKGERFGGAHRISCLIKVLNRLIRNEYYGSDLSHDIETGKNNLMPSEVLGKMKKIFERAMLHSLGGDHLLHYGDVYTLLGGKVGTYYFFRDLMIATRESIPDVTEDRHKPLVYMPDIKCYTCKYCKCDENGIRNCTKVATFVSAEKYAAHPNRYPDARHSEECEGLVSTIIDSRMDECEDYECRIK